MLLFVYTTTLKRFVIFTCRYFKLSWYTTVLSQSKCGNFSFSSINNEITVMVIVLTAWKQNIRMGESQRLNAVQIKLVYLNCFWIKYKHSAATELVIGYWTTKWQSLFFLVSAKLNIIDQVKRASESTCLIYPTFLCKVPNWTRLSIYNDIYFSFCLLFLDKVYPRTRIESRYGLCYAFTFKFLLTP